MNGEVRRTSRLQDVCVLWTEAEEGKLAPGVQSPLAPEGLDDADAGHSSGSLQFALHPANPRHCPIVHVVDLRPIRAHHRDRRRGEVSGRSEAAARDEIQCEMTARQTGHPTQNRGTTIAVCTTPSAPSYTPFAHMPHPPQRDSSFSSPMDDPKPSPDDAKVASPLVARSVSPSTVSSSSARMPTVTEPPTAFRDNGTGSPPTARQR